MTAMPSVRRRILGAALRRYRQDMGYLLDDAAHILECDRSKISRIETGQRGIRNRELHDLLTEYRADKQTQETLMIIANPRGVHSWRQASGYGLPDAYVDMMALEMAASNIMVYDAQKIPELLQCDEYALALAQRSADPISCQLRRWPTSSLHGQDKVLGNIRPEITAVIGEAALRHMPGDATVMRTQLGALVSAKSRFPEVRMQVLLSENGAHATWGVGSFTILSYAHVPDLQVAYLRGISGGFFVDDQREVTAYESAFQKLLASALTPDASTALIKQIQSEPAGSSRVYG